MYKFISSTEIEKAPKYITVDENTIANPLKEMLIELGYKELVEQEYPPTEDGYYCKPLYTDGKTITQIWSVPIKEIADETV